MRRHAPAVLQFAVCCLLLAAPSLCSAASVLFTNFGPGFSYDTSAGNPVGNGLDASGNDYAEGDAFTTTAAATLADVRIALSCVASCPDAVSVVLRADAAGQPGAALLTFPVAGGALGSLGSNNTPIDLIAPITINLSAATQYWITVQADTNDSVAWNLNSTGDTSDEAISIDDGASWFVPSGFTPGAFQIDGNPATATAPEPATIGLLLVAGFLLRRKRKNPNLIR